jgi:HK97 family phage major capsid protein
MINLKNNKILKSVINLIDEKSNGAITKLHSFYYIGDLEEYLVNGYIAYRGDSPYLKKIIAMDMLIRFPDSVKYLNGIYYSSRDSSVGYAVPTHIHKAIQDGIYRTSTLIKHLDMIKTEADHLNVAYNNVQGLRWPGESFDGPRPQDPDPEYLEVNMNVALLVFMINSKRGQIRAKSIEESYIEANIETLVEYFDKNILYGPNDRAQMSGLYPRYANKQTPKYDYVYEPKTGFNSEYLVTLKNNLPVKYRRDANWIMNSDTGRLIADEMGLSKERELPNTILGIPVIYNDYMDSVDSKDSVPVILVNLRKAYTFAYGEKNKGPSVRRFEEEIRSEKEEILALSRYRLGGRLTNPDALRVLLLKNEYGTKNNSTEVNHIYSNETEIATKLGSK